MTPSLPEPPRAPDAAPEPTLRRRGHVLPAVLIFAALIVILRFAGPHLPRFALWVDGLGIWGPVVYVLGYIVATIAFMPGALLTLAAGAIFGLGWGTVLAFTGETLGGVAAFLISRYLVRPFVARRLATSARFTAIDRAVAAKGARIVFLFRLSPLIPFNFLNYALGATNVRFIDYLLASIGMLPGAFLYVYYGKLTGDVAALAGGAAPARGAEYYAMLAFGLALTLVATTIVTRTAQRALRQATDV